MLVNSGFYEIKTSQQAHYPFLNCCVHVALQLYTLKNMLNVLNNGKQHNIETDLMVKVQLFCGVLSSVSTTAKSFVVCQIASYVYVKVKKFWLFSMYCFVC
jgi:hypothetical protein